MKTGAYFKHLYNHFKFNIMQDIKKRYEKIYGYIPTDNELYILYSQGQLWFLTDEQENEILQYFNF